MKYPKLVQEKINVLLNYQEKKTLEWFDIIHMYSTELAYPNGFYDSRFFELIGFNTQTMEKRNLGEHDAINFENIRIGRVSIFADGSTLLKFRTLITSDLGFNTQDITFNLERRSIKSDDPIISLTQNSWRGRNER